MSVEAHELLAISTLDGRDSRFVDDLRPIVSEFGLIGYRVEVEVEWLRTLANGDVLPGVLPFTEEQHRVVRSIATGFSIEDAKRVKEIESTTKHDVKAVEVWLRERLTEEGGFNDYLELIHFGCTSEDINNLAYAMMLDEVRDEVIFPALDEIGEDLESKTRAYAEIPLLAKTHGQSATPTTLGKEMGVFVKRVEKTRKGLAEISIRGKFNGATGTFGAHSEAYQDVDWQAVTRRFVESFGFTYELTTTQIEPHDYTARYLSELALMNTQLIDLATDVWQYISDGVYAQVAVEGEVGSSTMPHKVNPIDFEKAEANFGTSTALAQFLAVKLPQSRLQRDLSDSSAQRVLGTVFGHSLVALASLKKGLGKIAPNYQKIEKDLRDEWAILAEPLQTVMRRHHVRGAYDIIKQQTRGKEMSRDDYLAIVEGLEVPEEDKDRLRKLTPLIYVGKAPEIARAVRYDRGQ